MARAKTNKVDRWAIGVLVGRNEIKFVTKVERHPKTAYWTDGEDPKYFSSREEANEIALGLCINNTCALVIEVPDYIYLSNPPKEEPQKPKEKMFTDDRFIQKVCPKCESSEIRKGDKFCKDCGQELDWS